MTNWGILVVYLIYKFPFVALIAMVPCRGGILHCIFSGNHSLMLASLMLLFIVAESKGNFSSPLFSYKYD